MFRWYAVQMFFFINNPDPKKIISDPQHWLQNISYIETLHWSKDTSCKLIRNCPLEADLELLVPADVPAPLQYVHEVIKEVFPD